MHRSSSWKSVENCDNCSDASTADVDRSYSDPHNHQMLAGLDLTHTVIRSRTGSGSVSTGHTCIHRYRQPEFRDHSNRDNRYSVRGISSSTHGSFTNSRYRRGSCYSFDHVRRSRHQHSDIDLYRMHQHSQYDNMMHNPHAAEGALRQNSWSGSNMSLGSNRSRSSINREHKASGYKSRQCEESDSVQMITSNSHPLAANINGYDDENGGNVTYVAAGTAPVSSFCGGSCSAGSSSHTAALPLSTYATSVLPTGSNSHGLSPYQSDFNVPVDPCDLYHFNQGIPLQNNTSDDHPPSSAQELYSQKVSDMQTFTARSQLPHSLAAYFCHRLENERALLALLNMMTSLQQQCVSQRQAVADGTNRYFSEFDNEEDDNGVSTDQQQQLTATQLAGVLRALYPDIVGRGIGAGGGSAATSTRTRSPLDDLSQQSARGSEIGISEDILPILMQLMQQMGPINGGGSTSNSTASLDETFVRQEKMRHHLQQGTAHSTGGWTVQPALMQQLITQLNQMQLVHQQHHDRQSSAATARATTPAPAPAVAVRKTPAAAHLGHSPSSKSTSTESSQRPTSEYYSTVVARGQPVSGNSGSGSLNSAAASSVSRYNASTGKPESKVRPSSTTENVSQSVSGTTVLRNMKTSYEESGYQSESSPPLLMDSSRLGPYSSCEAESFASSVTSGLQSSGNTTAPSVTTTGTGATVSVATTTAFAAEPTGVPTASPTPSTSQLSRVVQYEISEMDVLSEEIWHYHNSITQSEKMLNRKLHLRDLLYYSICPVFPMCGLYVVGSSLNGFGNNTSDMDLCLMITNKDLDQKTDAVVVLNMILSTLQHTEWVSHQKLILAKVPILRIKFAAPFSDITVDLNANNSVAIKNTHLLCYYSSFDWRVRPLVSVVKEWAKRKGINDANRSSFTSYSLVLMVIHYLQCGTEPSVLPSLQQMFPRRFANKCDVRTLNVTVPLESSAISEWQYTGKLTLGELLIGFLDYYANKFDYDRDAISVRLGKRIDRAVIARQRPNGGYQQNNTHWRSQWRCICIEEPFTYSNTAHSIYDEMVFDAIKTAFREAHKELDATRDLHCLLNCQPISVNAPMGGAMVYVSSYNSARNASAGSIAGESPTNGHSRRSTPRGSSSGSSISTAHSATSSSSSSSSSDYGEDQDHERTVDVAKVASVPSRQHSKSLNRRLSRTNSTVSSCKPVPSPQIPVTETEQGID